MIVCIMKVFVGILLIIWNSVQRGCFAGNKRNWDEHVARYHKDTRQPIVDDDFLKIYEKEHYQFHKKEANKDNVLKWPILEQKNLDKYCIMYIHHIIPRIVLDGATGSTMNSATLRYTEDFPVKMNHIIVVKCIRLNFQGKYYYLTRAPESNCVYALLRDKGRSVTSFTIINKHCSFKQPTFSPKIITYLEREKIVKKLHKKTGQPIAKEIYIYKYEREHQKLFIKEANDGYLPWPYILEKKNLDEYCHQYVRKCNPRKIGNIRAMQTEEVLQYQNNEEEKSLFKVSAIKCILEKTTELQFYITRASENNCVYALLRQSGLVKGSFGIIFKHCDFEYFTNGKSDVPESSELPDHNVLLKYEVKEEKSDTLESPKVSRDYEIKKERLDAVEILHLFSHE